MAETLMDDPFERWAWLYTLCRERVFTDHTELVESVMRERSPTTQSSVFIELGCGPGFYSLSLAKRFPQWQFFGIDRCGRLLKRAQTKAEQTAVCNCEFKLGDATCVHDFPEPADLLLASRLLMILPDRLAALRSMYCGLRLGGLLLVAEPLPGWRSFVALRTMQLLSALGRRNRSTSGFRRGARAMPRGELLGLARQLPWNWVRHWSDDRYQYVLCERSAEDDAGYWEI